ncbi:prephenate dehydratase [Paenibacillus sp. J2TS4]|uniref:prephenate dehydratase n=1 Tax=Paenibacillus sp. J2TS4 TaxID=2807194 RepID=UPI001B236CCD|nr:prephenate dehydratase [Paenibacillus sp. J2TS4]GIP31383.1 prephenate dehydratase [Paenibacillus sp. J2TS4]
MTRIAFLGPEGTVSQESAHYFFNNDNYEYIPYNFISDVYNATVTGETDVSVIPIENTIDGSVKLHVDQLVMGHLPIQAEWIYPSMQNLIGYKPAGDEGFQGIDTIVSIDVAIAQCREFLKAHLPEVQFEFVSSTAEGVRRVQQQQSANVAAIGTSLAAKLYGLDVLASNITDHHNNYTRFILVGNSPPPLKAADNYKTTVLVTLPEDYPGALHQVLSAFAWRRINLSKIESRPTKLKLGTYYFYIDVEASMDSVLLCSAIEEVKALGCQLRILGSYPSYKYETTDTAQLEV